MHRVARMHEQGLGARGKVFCHSIPCSLANSNRNFSHKFMIAMESTDTDTQTEQLWRDLSSRLRLFIRSRISSNENTEDLLQETFIRIHRNIDTLQDNQKLTSWVFQIARNLIVDHYRSHGKKPSNTGEEVEHTSNSSENLNEEVMTWLPNVIEQLPETLQQATRLYEIEGKKQNDIAQQLGLSLTATKSRVQRGRQKIKALLKECCTFETDRYGNIVDYKRNQAEDCCDDDN